MTVHYAHTSHGSQITTGLEGLEARDATYAVARRMSGSEGLPPAETPAALRIYDGNPPDTYITPELYWDSAGGLDATRAVAGTGRYNVSMWSWCGQQSSNDAATVNRYLAAMSGLQGQFSNMRFVLMTGHTDGTDTPTQPRTLKYNNKLVRDYAIANGMALFDFADIESHDPAGTSYPTTNGTDSCAWCSAWCQSHPSDCVNLPNCSGGHLSGVNGLVCIQKAKAFWWMMARLAGWDGN